MATPSENINFVKCLWPFGPTQRHKMNASEIFNRQQAFFKTGSAMGLGPLDAEFCAV
jgi:hypothetical protein